MSAWTRITYTELSSAQANFTFANIPNTYTDLVIQLAARTAKNSLDDDIFITFNGSSTATIRDLVAKGTSVSSATRSNFIAYINGASTTSNTFSNVVCYIPNYAASANKLFSVDSVMETQDNTNNLLLFYSGQWSSTAAITDIVLTPVSASNFVSGSSATLYGITKGSSGGVVVG